MRGGQGFLAADLDGEGRAMGYFYGYVGLGKGSGLSADVDGEGDIAVEDEGANRRNSCGR